MRCSDGFGRGEVACLLTHSLWYHEQLPSLLHSAQLQSHRHSDMLWLATLSMFQTSQGFLVPNFHLICRSRWSGRSDSASGTFFQLFTCRFPNSCKVEAGSVGHVRQFWEKLMDLPSGSRSFPEPACVHCHRYSDFRSSSKDQCSGDKVNITGCEICQIK